MDMKSRMEKDIDYYGSDRRELHIIFPKGTGNVLDVGCGSGMFGRELKKRGVKKVTGIEMDKRAAGLAKNNLDKVIIADIEKTSFEFMQKEFDVIVFADILEHLKNPWFILGKMKEYLKPGGHFLISVPNIRYVKVLLDLIFKGEFKYETSGILDITHVRFFTFKSAKDMLEEAGFLPVKIYRNFSGKISRLLNFISFNICSDFFTRQYIILAKQKNER